MKNVINLLSRDLSLSNLTEGWLMIKQLNQSTIVTGNSMFYSSFKKKKNITLNFYFCDTCEIIKINTLINILTRVKVTKYLPSGSS